MQSTPPNDGSQSGRWGVLSPQQLQEVIVAAHALLTAGDEKAAQSLLGAFTSSGVDALC